MPNEPLKYCDYFKVDENYFPCIDESAIREGARWDITYPHETFIKLLTHMERMLSGGTGRSLWIHGDYGTGKSRCAFTLKEMLEVPEEELRAYWNKYEPLKQDQLLLNKFIGHRKQGVVTAYRYASGTITGPRQLFFAVQESLQKALSEHNTAYMGENTLKDSVIAWLQDPTHAHFMDELLRKPKWQSTFSQSSAEEIIHALRKSKDTTSLMDNIFELADEEGITALDLTADSLREWILDVIQRNHIKLVLIWDEFSDYFRQNTTSLGEFQKLVAICQEAPFYFIIVTHRLDSLNTIYAGINKNNPFTVVQQRFTKVQISLPDNIAFDLIADAFKVKDKAKAQWLVQTDDMYASVADPCAAVEKAANLSNKTVLRDILPIHPMAAFVLEHIASAFQSNQRSMFDFIKETKDPGVHAFQWFIETHGPLSDRPLLTVDMLWDFFYENGKDSLSQSIRMILDTFYQQKNLTDNEKIVLKTILILQAMDQKYTGDHHVSNRKDDIRILEPTSQNVSYAFQGDARELEDNCINIANSLVKKGILFPKTYGDGSKAYSVTMFVGDAARVEELEKKIREEHGSTAELVSQGEELPKALSLTPPLRLRYAIDFESGRLPVVTPANFKKTMEELKTKGTLWRCYAVLALAKTAEEGVNFRDTISKAMADPAYANIAVIDALSSPLGLEDFEKYVSFSAMSQLYAGNDNQQSSEYNRKAKDVLNLDWRNRIYSGQFIVFTGANPQGEHANGAGAVHTILQTLTLKRFPHVQDFTRGLTETQLKLTTSKPIAKYGIEQSTVKGVIAGCEKSVLGKFWQREKYWEDENLAGEHIVIIKQAVNAQVDEAFNGSGKISIGEIYDQLEHEFGFSPCNLSAFITGFLLKEYSGEPYRYMNAEGHREEMTPDKLAEMIGNYIGKSTKPKPTYIVSLTPEEKAFYELTEEAWNIIPNTCSSPQDAGSRVLTRMRELKFPVWCLEDVDTTGAFDLVKLYISLVQSKGDDAHDVANRIGGIALQRRIRGRI